MSSRTIFAGIVVLAAIGIANIIFLLRAQHNPPVVSAPAAAPPLVQPAIPQPLAVATSVSAVGRAMTPPATAAAASANNAPSSSRGGGPRAAGDFALERQTFSPSKNLRVSYWRDRMQKVRRITLEDSRHPEASTVLYQAKGNAWALISPDDQWIALDDRSNPEAGGVRLFHRKDAQGVQFEPMENPSAGQTLQDTVWHAYLNSTQGDPAAARHGVTIDATAWEPDSRTLDVSIAYMRSAGDAEVPDPWSCNYDVVSNKVQPLDQPEPAGQPTEQPAQLTQTSTGPSEPSSDGNVEQQAEETEFPGEKFPATRTDELTVPDVNESDLSEINYAINEMFARHGADFGDKKVTKQFAQFPWYTARPEMSMDQIESEFSDLEKQNLKVLGRCRDAKRASARRGKSRPVRGQQVQPDGPGAQILNGILEGLLNNLPN